jgi:hypothetical protein
VFLCLTMEVDFVGKRYVLFFRKEKLIRSLLIWFSPSRDIGPWICDLGDSNRIIQFRHVEAFSSSYA